MINRYRPLRRQQGITLLVALIMLLLTTLLVTSSFNLGSSSVQTVSNMQSRGEAVNAAQETIEQVISSKRFSETPNAVFATGCDGHSDTKCIDTNGDGVTDVRVTLSPAPACIQARTMQNHELDLANASEAGCASQTAQEAFGQGGSTSASECAATTWEIQANAADAVTRTQVSVVQGVSLAIPKNSLDTVCP